jgi:uncharacterized membrane protein YbjE (DUF340 family)
MIVVLLCLAGGILAGALLRRSERLLTIIDQLTGWFIYVFLFLLGLSVGANREIIANFGRLGLQAVIIALACVTGSLIPAWFVYRYFFRRSEK